MAPREGLPLKGLKLRPLMGRAQDLGIQWDSEADAHRFRISQTDPV